jgi:hypothetical protein
MIVATPVSVNPTPKAHYQPGGAVQGGIEMRSKSITPRRAALAGLTVALNLFVLAGTASARTLAGAWAPFNRCPVESVAMLEADGENTIALCAAMEAPSGSLIIGHLSTPFKEANAQFGLVASSGELLSTVSPAGGVFASAPIQVPGGLQVVCAGQHGVVRNLCELASKRVNLNKLYAQLESVGTPSNLNVAGAFGTEVPAISLPTRIHLINPLLGPECTIGTAKEPIALAPVSTSPPELGAETFAPNGTPVEGGPLEKLVLYGANKADTTFTVPRAHKCAALAPFGQAIDHAIGLPSPSGANSLVLEKVSVELALFAEPSVLAPNEGKDLAKAWHSAIVH